MNVTAEYYPVNDNAFITIKSMLDNIEGRCDYNLSYSTTEFQAWQGSDFEDRYRGIGYPY